MDKYLFIDRTSEAVMALQITSGAFNILPDDSDIGDVPNEPVFKDTDSTTRWRLFINNTAIGIESVAGSTLNEEVILEDTATTDRWRLQVEGGVLTFSALAALTVEATGPKKHFVNDIGTVILIDTGTDITEADELQVRIMKPDGTEIIREGQATGQETFKFVVQNGDFDQEGLYQLQARIISGAGRWRGETDEFYVYDEFE